MSGNRIGGSTGLGAHTGVDPGTSARVNTPAPGPVSGTATTTLGANVKKRELTPGEIAMARLLFQDAIDYAKVNVHNEEYLPFGLQRDDTAMTPNGEMYFNPKHFRHDYSQEDNGYKHWFMHEMVHVWQYQSGYPVKMRGAFRIGLDYEYTLSAQKKLDDYNMEAQGDLLADYYALKHLQDSTVMRCRQYRGNLPLYETVLAGFLANPHYLRQDDEREKREAQERVEGGA